MSKRITIDINDIATPPPMISKETGTWLIYDGDKYVDTGITAKGAKGDKGDKGDKGNPGKDVDPKLLREIQGGLQNAKTLIDTLEKAQKEIKEGKLDSQSIQWLLDALNGGKTIQDHGLLLTQVIALSNKIDKITAYISGMDGEGKSMLAAGVEGFGTDQETAVSKINYDGSAKFGDLYIGRNASIGFGSTDKRYMQIGGEALSEQELLSQTSRRVWVDEDGLSQYRIGFDDASTQRTVGIRIPEGAKGTFVWEADLEIAVKGDPRTGSQSTCVGLSVLTGVYDSQIIKIDTPTDKITEKKVHVKLSIPVEEIVWGKVEITINGKSSVAPWVSDYFWCTPRSVRYTTWVSTGDPIVSIAPDKAAFFYGRKKHVLLNYRPDTALAVSGGMTVDEVRSNHLVGRGAVYFAGEVLPDGSVRRRFGDMLPRKVIYDGGAWHIAFSSSLSLRYIPIITVAGVEDETATWSLAPKVMSSSRWGFKVRILSNQDNPKKVGFYFAGIYV